MEGMDAVERFILGGAGIADGVRGLTEQEDEVLQCHRAVCQRLEEIADLAARLQVLLQKGAKEPDPERR
jgi:hypothetical protein